MKIPVYPFKAMVVETRSAYQIKINIYNVEYEFRKSLSAFPVKTKPAARLSLNEILQGILGGTGGNSGSSV